MTHDERGLLDYIIQHPEEDAARLIYADWLEDHSSPRSDLIRVQVRLAVMEPLSAYFFDGEPEREEYDGLRKRERELYQAIGIDPATGAPSGIEQLRWVWSRGFITSIKCPLAAWLAHGPDMASRHPLEGGVEVRDRHPLEEADRSCATWFKGMGQMAPQGHLFRAVTDTHPESRETVPVALWPHLSPEQKDEYEHIRVYNGDDISEAVGKARRALFAALILWARDEAKRRVEATV